jgi:glycosyltransferase involved in cell wall biosynthesis
MRASATTASAHLAIFVRSLAGGGAERNMTQLAGGLAELGHRVDLVLARPGGDFAGEVPPGVRRVDLGGPQWGRTVAALMRDRATARALAPSLISAHPPAVLACAPALAGYLRAERPDALLSALVYANVAALWARRLAGTDTRVVVSERNAVFARVGGDARRRIQRIPELLRRFYPEADAIACVSGGVADDVARATGIPRERICATWSPVVTPGLAAGARPDPPHAWLAPGAPPVVLGVGKLKPQKRFDTLVLAFARLRATRPARLVILGRGPQRQPLLALARRLGVAQDVLLPGFASDPFAWMRHAAVFALSSAWEGLPSVLIQALACGCPVVSTDCPHGPREILEGGAHGPLVPVGDDAALARALAGVLDQPPPAAALRRRAEAFAVAPVVAATLPLLLGADAPRRPSSSAASRSATASTV